MYIYKWILYIRVFGLGGRGRKKDFVCLHGWLGRKLGENDGHLLHCFEPLSGRKSEGESLQELISERQRLWALAGLFWVPD